MKNRRHYTRHFHEQKNGLMLDVMRLLSVWSPMITQADSDPEPVICYAIQQTLDLTFNFDNLKTIAFIHSPKGTESKKDWLQFFKNQEACDRGRTLTPPRYGKGAEFSVPLEIVNYQSTLKSLARARHQQLFTINFNLSKALMVKAENSPDATKFIIDKINYRLKCEFGDNTPLFYLMTEFAKARETRDGFAKGEMKRHYHGTMVLDPKDLASVRRCFKQVNPEPRSIVLKKQPDILNFYPIRWGGYVTKDINKTKELTSHLVYAARELKREAKYHYETISRLVRACQGGCLSQNPAERLKTLAAEFN